MIEFSKQVCPLCETPLQHRMVSRVQVYACPTQIEYHPNGFKSHYEVDVSEVDTIQHIIILPYEINTSVKDNNSRIYKRTLFEISENSSSWSFIRQLPRIKEDTEVNLRNRLKRLMTFS